MHSILKPFAVALLSLTMGLQTSAADTALSAEDGWKHLSLREKIGQTVILSSDIEAEKKAGGGSLKVFFEKYPVAGVFLGSWKFQQVDARFRSASIRQRVEEYRAASRIPLFFQEDYEQGPGAALQDFTHLPILMALGATDSPALASAYGKALAAETRSLGFNWLLNPVADLNRNFLNPVVNTRSLSDDPERVVRMLSHQIQAMQDKGLISTIKHFPGDGVDFRDQHMVTSVNSLSLPEWHSSYGRVFQQLINQGVPSVMIGHISLPAYQKERIHGHLLPASLSKEIITDLLKREMGFKGIVISDALNMGGLQSYYPNALETQLQAFKAGTDLMLWPSLAYVDALEQRVLSGEISMQRLDDAVSRIWTVKRRFGLLDGRNVAATPYSDEQRKVSELTAKQVAEASITLVRDQAKLLPLQSSKGSKLLFVVVAPASMAQERLKTFAPTVAALQSRGFQVDLRANLSFYENETAAFEGYDRIVFAFDRHTHAPMGTMNLYETEALTVWSANALPRSKVISISYGDPYVHEVALPLAEVAINAYSNCAASQQALVRALTGEIPFNGKSPVNLESLHKRLNP